MSAYLVSVRRAILCLLLWRGASSSASLVYGAALMGGVIGTAAGMYGISASVLDLSSGGPGIHLFPGVQLVSHAERTANYQPDATHSQTVVGVVIDAARGVLTTFSQVDPSQALAELKPSVVADARRDQRATDMLSGQSDLGGFNFSNDTARLLADTSVPTPNAGPAASTNLQVLDPLTQGLAALGVFGTPTPNALLVATPAPTLGPSPVPTVARGVPGATATSTPTTTHSPTTPTSTTTETPTEVPTETPTPTAIPTETPTLAPTVLTTSTPAATLGTPAALGTPTLGAPTPTSTQAATPTATPLPGRVILTTSAPATGFISASAMAPGTSVSSTVVLRNGGNLTFDSITMSTAPSGAQSRLWTDANGLKLRVRRAGTQIYDGPIAVSNLDLGSALGPGGEETLEIEVYLPFGADNTLQGESQSVAFTWTATTITCPPMYRCAP